MPRFLRITPRVYNCGCQWDEVVYNGVVVGDSGILIAREVYGDKFAWNSTAIAPPIVVGFQANSELSRYVDWRIQAYVGSQETAVRSV